MRAQVRRGGGAGAAVARVGGRRQEGLLCPVGSSTAQGFVGCTQPQGQGGQALGAAVSVPCVLGRPRLDMRTGCKAGLPGSRGAGWWVCSGARRAVTCHLVLPTPGVSRGGRAGCARTCPCLRKCAHGVHLGVSPASSALRGQGRAPATSAPAQQGEQVSREGAEVPGFLSAALVPVCHPCQTLLARGEGCPAAQCRPVCSGKQQTFLVQCGCPSRSAHGDPCVHRPHFQVHRRLFLMPKTSGNASKGWTQAFHTWKWG